MVNSFLCPIQRMLKQRDLKVSDSTIKGFLEDIDQAAPWFGASGDVNLPCWEKLGQDLTEAKGRGELRPGTLPLWRMIRYCLKDGKCVDILREGRWALSAHQDSMSESDNITLSDSAEDELDSEEEEDLEEAAAAYEREREYPQVRIIHYMDDILLAAPSQVMLDKAYARTVRALEKKGLYIAPEKVQKDSIDCFKNSCLLAECWNGTWTLAVIVKVPTFVPIPVEADPKTFPIMTPLRERRDFGITAAIAAIALSAASAITAAIAMTNQIQSAQTINTVVEQTSAVMEMQHRINKHLMSGIVAAKQRMDLIQTQVEELFGLIQIGCIAKLKHMCVTPLRFEEARNESRKIVSYLAGNWTRDIELLMSKQLLQIAALNET
ncbi:hypothetical protein STEG23_004564 [Scotinomys teguina]